MRHNLILCVLPLLLVACATAGPPKRKPPVIEGRAAQFIPGYGFSIDVSYDRRLDNIVPGYKLLTVVIRNTSLNVIPGDSKKDRWVVVDGGGGTHRAINSLRVKNRKAWFELPEKLRQLIDYPESIPISYTATFDLLFPLSTPLEDIEEVRYRNAAWGQQFIVHKE